MNWKPEPRRSDKLTKRKKESSRKINAPNHEKRAKQFIRSSRINNKYEKKCSKSMQEESKFLVKKKKWELVTLSKVKKPIVCKHSLKTKINKCR